ncbi:MAG: M23 family metallopeptidase [Chloroflexi bacterium]|nr:M23 family metallopeptidase [Chloroflexota bacterium]
MSRVITAIVLVAFAPHVLLAAPSLFTAHLLSVTASSPSDTAILFAWNGTLFANTLHTGEVTALGPVASEVMPDWPGHDVYTVAAAPLGDPPTDGYGFHHGVWSSDHTRFAYLEIAAPRYRLWLHTSAGERVLLRDDQRDEMRGYLDPVGWTPAGEVLLLERVLLNHLHQANMWRLDPTTLTLQHHAFVPLERLSGRCALLPDASAVFLGYHLGQQVGYLLDVATGQVQTFPARLDQVVPPARGFEYYPLQVVGALRAEDLSADDLAAVTAQVQSGGTVPEAPARPAPFLYWPLPDDARSITCYPDSPWTTANFDVTCPGLSSPRNYVGHQGTDVGGKPDGLPPGTPVYPSAPGVVVASFRACLPDNPGCNAAYGNTVTVEHVLVVHGETQVWYTGYGHLQTVLVDDYALLEDVTLPLALSGATGDGGPHLHFEVRTPDGWVDPWDNRAGTSLWLGSNIRPLTAVAPDAVDPEAADSGALVLAECTSFAGNNIRGGPGTTYDVVGTTVENQVFQVLEITFVSGGAAPGDWYHVQFEGGEGWLWSGLLSCP